MSKPLDLALSGWTQGSFTRLDSQMDVKKTGQRQYILGQSWDS